MKVEVHVKVYEVGGESGFYDEDLKLLSHWNQTDDFVVINLEALAGKKSITVSKKDLLNAINAITWSKY